MSLAPTLPPGTVQNQDSNRITVTLVSVNKQDGIVPGDQITVRAEYFVDPFLAAQNIRMIVTARSGTRFFQDQVVVSPGTTSLELTFTNPPNGFQPDRSGSLTIDVGSSSIFNDFFTVPMNAGFSEPGNGGGSLVFGDLDAGVNVSNIADTGAVVNGSIFNKTQKSGDIAIYIEIRDSAGISVLNNSPLNNQAMTAGGTLTASLIAGQLLPNTSYEARVFALDSTHTVPLSPIAVAPFTTTGGGPGPGPGDPLVFGDIAPGLVIENITQTDANVIATMTNLTGKMGTIGVYIEIQDQQGNTHVINEPIPIHSISANASVSDTLFLHLLEPGTTYRARTFALDASLTVPLSSIAELEFTTLQPGQEPPPSSSGFQLIALPLFMGALAYVWPDEEKRKKRYNKLKAVIAGTVRGTRREIDKATRALIRGVNRK